MPDSILQMCGFTPYLEQQLQSRFEVHRWFDIGAQDEWLDAQGKTIRGVVTGGHIGISNDLMARLPHLGVVAINGVGFDKVDLSYAREHAIRVSTTPDVLTDDVADLAVGTIINLLRGIAPGDRFVRDGRWPRGEMPLGRKVSGRCFGILGLGRIGQAIAARLVPFGSIAYADTAPKAVPYRYFSDRLELARACDVLVLSAAADASTRNLVGRSTLDALGPDGYLVNVARGSLVNESELIAALVEKRIAGAALDVFADEPRVPVQLLDLPNVLLTPHIASATVEARENMARLVLANLTSYFSGTAMPTALV